MRCLALTFAAAAIGLFVVIAGPAGSKPAPRFPVTGYVIDSGGTKAISRQASQVSDVGVDGALVDESGKSLIFDSLLVPALKAAHRLGRPASLLVSNYDNDIGDFSPEIGSRLLRHGAHRQAVIHELANQVRKHGWDGVTIDLEALADGDRQGLTLFVTELRAALPKSATLDIDLPADAAPGGYEWKPFDRKAIGRIVSHVVVMSYDQHYQGGTAGPIAGFGWVKKTIGVITSQVPRSKVRLGIAGYGYLWRDGKPTVDLTDARARKLAGSLAHWSPRQKEWTAKLRGGGVIWWSDRRSIRLRLALARQRGLQGAALWRLGSADNFR